jgi:hypothetical protein
MKEEVLSGNAAEYLFFVYKYLTEVGWRIVGESNGFNCGGVGKKGIIKEHKNLRSPTSWFILERPYSSAQILYYRGQLQNAYGIKYSKDGLFSGGSYSSIPKSKDSIDWPVKPLIKKGTFNIIAMDRSPYSFCHWNDRSGMLYVGLNSTEPGDPDPYAIVFGGSFLNSSSLLGLSEVHFWKGKQNYNGYVFGLINNGELIMPPNDSNGNVVLIDSFIGVGNTIKGSTDFIRWANDEFKAGQIVSDVIKVGNFWLPTL